MNLKRLFLILATAAFVAASCNPYKIEIPNHGNNNTNTGANNNGNNSGNTGNEGGNTEAQTSVIYPTPGVAKTKTLLTSGTFTERQLQKGIIYYTFNGKDEITGVWQNVNVVELDLKITIDGSDKMPKAPSKYKKISEITEEDIEALQNIGA